MTRRGIMDKIDDEGEGADESGHMRRERGGTCAVSATFFVCCSRKEGGWLSQAPLVFYNTLRENPTVE